MVRDVHIGCAVAWTIDSCYRIEANNDLPTKTWKEEAGTFLIAGCGEVEPSSQGLVNACAGFPSEDHAAHRYAWVNNSATCGDNRLLMSNPLLPLRKGRTLPTSMLR